MSRTEYQILRLLATGPKDFWQLISKQDTSIKEFAQELKNLCRRGVIKKENGLFELNREKIDRKINKYFESCCRVCGDGIDFTRDFKTLLNNFEKAVEKRPLPREEYDQGFMRIEDTVKRAIFMYERADVEKKNIFILGDDDLLSLAIGLMGFANLVTVAEVDERIVDFIRKRAKDLGISSIRTVNYNALNELPFNLCGQYDTFVTDPVETLPGLKIFIARCMKSLKGAGSSGYFGLTHLEASLKKWWEIEKFLLNCSFVITDILRDFSLYPEDENRWEKFYQSYRLIKEIPDVGLPGVDWYRSSFFRIEAVNEINFLQLPLLSFSEELYLDDETWATPHS
ncbi:bis-aminopropyl spermidine synthase family protein [Candidatus Aerophobetes bacterium]|nr:bis-aminopropyl spermidine synthase family protein [Candidatus Aerophobetes bacterium]